MKTERYDLRGWYELIRDDMRNGELHSAGMRLIGKMQPMDVLVREFDVSVTDAVACSTPYSLLAQMLMERYDKAYAAEQLERKMAGVMYENADPTSEQVESVRLMAARVLSTMDEQIDDMSAWFHPSYADEKLLERVVKIAADSYVLVQEAKLCVGASVSITEQLLQERCTQSQMRDLCERLNLLGSFHFLAEYLHSLV